MYPPNHSHASHFVLGSHLRDSLTLLSSGFTCLLLIANETVPTESGKIQMPVSSPKGSFIFLVPATYLAGVAGMT